MSNLGLMMSLLGMKLTANAYAKLAINMARSADQFSAAGYVWHIHAIQKAQDGD